MNGQKRKMHKRKEGRVKNKLRRCRKEKVGKEKQEQGQGIWGRKKYGKLGNYQQEPGNKSKLQNFLGRRLPPFLQHVGHRIPYLFRDKSLSMLNTRTQMSFDSSVQMVHANDTDTAQNLF